MKCKPDFLDGCHFDGTLASTVARSDTPGLFLMPFSERCRNKPEFITLLESKHYPKKSCNLLRDAEHNLPKYDASSSTLPGRQCWSLPKHTEVPSIFSYTKERPVQLLFVEQDMYVVFTLLKMVG